MIPNREPPYPFISTFTYFKESVVPSQTKWSLNGLTLDICMLKVEANFWDASTPFLTDNNKPMKRNWIKLNPTKGRVHSRLELEFLNSIFNAILVLIFQMFFKCFFISKYFCVSAILENDQEFQLHQDVIAVAVV